MHARLGDGDYVVEEQDTRPDVVEILVAARRDPQLGAVVVVGAGGTETEIHRDVRLECAPVSHDAATAMLDGLRAAPLLHGWRGRSPVDVDKLADVVVAVSRLIAQPPRHRRDRTQPGAGRRRRTARGRRARRRTR